MVRLSSIVAVVVVLSVAGPHLESTATAQQTIAAGKQKEVDRTTPLLNRMTAAQREHAKLFKHFRQGSRDRLLDRGLSLDITRDFVSLSTSGRPAPEVLAEVACGADAVFAGEVISAETLPTEDGAFLFTDYQILLSEVFRARPGIDISRGETVVLSRPGGETVVDGTRVAVTITGFRPLSSDASYVFAVQYLRRTRSFWSENSDGLFSLVDSRIKPTSALGLSDQSAYVNGWDLPAVRESLRGGVSCR